MIEQNDKHAGRLLLTALMCVVVLECVLYGANNLLGERYRLVVIAASMLIAASIPFTIGYLWKQRETSQNFRRSILFLILIFALIGIGDVLWTITSSPSRIITHLFALLIIVVIYYIPFIIGKTIGAAK